MSYMVSIIYIICTKKYNIKYIRVCKVRIGPSDVLNRQLAHLGGSHLAAARSAAVVPRQPERITCWTARKLKCPSRKYRDINNFCAANKFCIYDFCHMWHNTGNNFFHCTHSSITLYAVTISIFSRWSCCSIRDFNGSFLKLGRFL